MLKSIFYFHFKAKNSKLYLQDVDKCNFASHATSYICDSNFKKSCNSSGVKTFEIERRGKYSLVVCYNKHELFKTETENCLIWDINNAKLS